MGPRTSTLLVIAACVLLMGCGRTSAPGHSILRSTVEGPASIQASDIITARSFGTGHTGYAVGTMEEGGALVARTADGGADWVVILRDPEGFRLRDVDFVDARRGWVVGGPVSAGMIWATADGGTTWTAQGDGDYRALTQVDFTDPLHGEVRGSDGDRKPLVLRTSDGGASWIR